MADLDDQRAIRRLERIDRSRLESAAAVPCLARRSRTRRAEVPREAVVPAARAARSSSSTYHEGDPDEVTVAPPPVGWAEAPVRPPKGERSVPAARVRASPAEDERGSEEDARPRTAYMLRNRHVSDTSNREAYIPARSEKREKLKHDRPCSPRKKLKQDEPWEATSCARAGLEHYNSINQGDEHELVKALGVHSFIWCGGWLHANFLARRKGASNCVDIVPKYFFAELKLDGFGLSCCSCIKLDTAESKNISYCGVCPRKIMHPATGVYLGAQTRRIRPAETGL